MAPDTLLTMVARELQEEAGRYVPLVVRAGIDAVPPPFGPLIGAQDIIAPEHFQLPEPLLHPIANPNVLVVGLNPGFNPTEAMPTLASSLEDYVNWYRTRFDAWGRTRTGWPASTRDANLDKGGRSHYAEVERILVAAGLGPRPLGRCASYADAIPWKGMYEGRAPTVRDPLLAEMALQRLRRIVEGLQPGVILTLGPDIGDLLGATHPRDPVPNMTSLGEWHGNIVSMYHPNHRFVGPGTRIAHRTEVATAIASVL